MTNERKEKTEPIENDVKDISHIKFWGSRIKFNTNLKYIFFFGPFLLYIILTNIFVGFIFYFLTLFAVDVLFVFCITLALYFEKKIPREYEEILKRNEGMFQSEAISKEFKNYVKGIYNSRLGIILPPLIAVMVVIGTFYLWGISTNFQPQWGGRVYELSPDMYSLYLFHFALRLFNYFFLFLMTFSGVTIVLSTFISLNKLGIEKYPLNITYKDLKVGVFNRIGKFILSFTIPTLILAITVSVVGFLSILTSEINVGNVLLGAGVAITVITAFLLYKNTFHLHKAIAKFKIEMLNSLSSDIQAVYSLSSGEIKSHEKYDAISKIIIFYDNVDSIIEWPFSAGSLKKLIIALISSSSSLILAISRLGLLPF